MLCQLSQTNRRVRPDATFVVPRLQPRQVPHYLHVQVIRVELGSQREQGTDGVLSDRRVGVLKPEHQIWKDVRVDGGRAQVRRKLVHVLQQAQPRGPVLGLEEPDDERQDGGGVVFGVEQARVLEDGGEGADPGAAKLVRVHQRREYLEAAHVVGEFFEQLRQGGQDELGVVFRRGLKGKKRNEINRQHVIAL